MGAGGQVGVLDAGTGKEGLWASGMQGRVTGEDVKGLNEPLLVSDAERFYVALNKPAKVAAGMVQSNFSNGIRCQSVNGFVAAFHRKDGEKKVTGQPMAYKKGDMAWHSQSPLRHQMIVLEQFDHL